ncbi:hypothetical protein V8G54_033957 [Vigna mungo]|uniref:Uncharacterized protein n=1 Tax=Vigna mungo TaxID=3915 RepID=A0AAQ3MNU4_VIGMU
MKVILNFQQFACHTGETWNFSFRVFQKILGQLTNESHTVPFYLVDLLPHLAVNFPVKSGDFLYHLNASILHISLVYIFDTMYPLNSGCDQLCSLFLNHWTKIPINHSSLLRDHKVICDGNMLKVKRLTQQIMVQEKIVPYLNNSFE